MTINYNDKSVNREGSCLLSGSQIRPDWDVVRYPLHTSLRLNPLLSFSCGRDNLMPPHAEIPLWVIQFFTRLRLYQPHYPTCLFVLPQCSHRSGGRATRTSGPLLWVALTLFQIRSIQRVWTFRRCSNQLHVQTHTPFLTLLTMP